MVDNWAVAEKYEPYVGRWSRLVAREFVGWLGVASASSWLDVGCGTGALSSAIVGGASPSRLLGIDPSAAFVEYARAHVDSPVARFEVGDAMAIAADDNSFDASVAGLVLNFVPDKVQALREMARVAPVVGIYVWDYAGEMWLMRHFWDAAAELFDSAREMQESLRFADAQPPVLEALFRDASLTDVVSTGLVVPTVFRDFDDYWNPFLGGQGPAPSYAQTLAPEHLVELREAIRERLPVAEDGSIPLTARAWAVCGRHAA